LADDAPQGRLGQLGSGVKVIFNSDHGLIGIYHAEVDDRIDFDGDVVTGNHILGWDLQRHRPQADPEQLVDSWDDEDDPRSLRPDQSSKAEDNASFILSKDLDGRGGKDNEKDDQKKDSRDPSHKVVSFTNFLSVLRFILKYLLKKI